MPTDTTVFLAHTTVSITHQVAIWPFSIHETETEVLSQEEKSARHAAHKAIVAKLCSGAPVDEDAMERRYGCLPGFRAPKSPAPFMSFGGSMAVVTQPVRTLLEELAPGPMKFFPIEVFAADLKTPIWPDETLYVIQVLEARQDCLIAQSTSIRSKTIPNPAGKPIEMHSIGTPDETYKVVTQEPPKGAADIWTDDRILYGPIFMTDRVAKALKKASLARGWRLTECHISEPGVENSATPSPPPPTDGVPATGIFSGFKSRLDRVFGQSGR